MWTVADRAGERTHTRNDFKDLSKGFKALVQQACHQDDEVRK